LVYYENKGVSGSIHYRNAPDPAVARERILEVVSPLADREGLRLTHGRMVIELRPPVPINKGTALSDIVSEFALRSIIFMGDDVTDLDAMRALARIRSDSDLLGLSIGVVGPETPDEVAEESDRVVHGVEGVADLLASVVELVTRQPGQRASGDENDRS
jgi:trehalose 6-phosphate phosphatase